VSQLGDFILSPGSTFDLERFLDSSLTTGKRFRFVSLDHPDVDDSSREENGTVKVEFRLEKKVEPIKIVPGCHPIVKNSDLWICDEDDRVWLHISDAKRNVLLGSNTAKFSAADNYSDSSMVVSNTTSSTLPGATIGGRESQQAFSYAHVDVEDEMTVLMLRIVGIAPRLSYLWPW